MPDLVTHLSVAYFVSKIPRVTKWAGIVYLGSALPDLATRPIYVIFPSTFHFVSPMHTPLVLIPLCLLVSFLFDQTHRGAVFVVLLVASYLHLLLDVLQTHDTRGYAWFFPFSDRSFEIGLFPQDGSVYAVPFLLAAILTVELISRRTRRRQNHP